MNPKTWKTIAIIFIVLFTLETSMILYGNYLINKETKETNSCYYDICEEYPEAIYDSGICYCYDYDVLGNLNVVKTKVVGG